MKPLFQDLQYHSQSVWVRLGLRVLLAKLPDTCRCLGREGGRTGERERGTGQSVSGLRGRRPPAGFRPLASLGAAEPLGLLCGAGGSRLPSCVALGRLPLFFFWAWCFLKPLV